MHVESSPVSKRTEPFEGADPTERADSRSVLISPKYYCSDYENARSDRDDLNPWHIEPEHTVHLQ